MKLNLPKAFWLLLLSSGAAFAQDCGTPAPDVSEIITCPNNEIGNLEVNGSNIKWYESEVGGAALHPDTSVSSVFSTYYVTQTIDGCESPRAAVQVSTYDIDNSVSQFPQIACEPFPASQLPNLLYPDSRWYASPYDTQTIDPNVMIGTVTLYYAIKLNGCESQRFPVYFIKVPKVTFYEDLDGDGYGNPAAPILQSCDGPGGYATITGDCDDNNEDIGNCNNIQFTKLSSGSCGNFLESFYQPLQIDEVDGATQYRVRIYDEEINEVITISSTSFTFSQFENALYARAYIVQVAAFVDGVWGEYGDICGILTPLRGTTKIQDSQCGVAITNINTNIYADNVEGAIQYNFRVRNGNFEYIVEKDVPWFKFSEVEGFTYGTTYTIDVSAFTSLGPVNFGTDCTVATPAAPLTKIRASQCGSTVAGFSSGVFAVAVSGATNYRFKVTNGGTTQVIETPNPWFALQQVTGHTYNAVYSVQVASFTSQWTEYGEACTISAPPAGTQLTQVWPSICGTTVSFTSGIFANGVQLAEGYRFRVVSAGGGTQIVDSPMNYIKLNQVPGYNYNTVYTIDVAVRLNGQWGDYGPACTVSTPVQPPVTTIRTQDCGATINSRRDAVYANRVANVAIYRFRIQSTAGTQTTDQPLAYFKFNQLTGIAAGETVTIDVMTISTNGIASDYGPTCNVTLSGSASRMAAEHEGKASAKTYPNPFVEGFAVSYETESAEQVNVSVFDMNGRQLENFTSEPSGLADKRFGTGYAAGIYNVVVTQGSNQKVLHVVKN